MTLHASIFAHRSALFTLPLIAIFLALACCERSAAIAQEAKGSDAATRQYATAAALQNREQYELAIDEWKKFLANYPKDERADKANHYLGLCLLQAKQFEPAMAAFQRVIADYPKSTMAEPSYLYQGLAQYNLARGGKAEFYPQAEATFRALLEKFPRSKNVPQAAFYRGESLYAQGKKAEAVTLYEYVVKNFPQDPRLPDALYALGVAQDELGEAAAAEATFATLTQKFPKSPLLGEVTLRRGEALLAQKKYAEAEKFFASAAARPGFALADQALLRQAASLAERQQYIEAAALYGSLAKKFPKSKLIEPARLAMGRSQYLAGQPAQARETLGPVFQAGGESGVEAGHLIARCYLKERQPAEALAVVDKLTAQAGAGPWAVQLAVDRADALVESPDKVDEAIAAFAKIAREHPDDPLSHQALYMAAFSSLRQKQYEPALAYAADFIKRYPDDALRSDVQFVSAESQLQLARYSDAARQLSELIAANPKHRDADQWKVRRGLALYLDKKYAETVAALEPIAEKLASKPLRAEALFLLGSAQNELKQPGSAVRSLTASLSADPHWKQADETLLALSLALQQSGDVPAARGRLEQFAKLYPKSRALDRAHFRLGELAYAMGDWPVAAREYKLTLDLFPQSPVAPQAAYGLAWTELSQQNFPAAIKSLDALIAGGGPLAGKARYARGFARQQQKDYPAAIEDMQAFLKASPEKPEKSEAQYILAVCQAATGKATEAEATLRALLQEDPEYAGADKALYELAWALDSQDKKPAAAEVFTRLARGHATSPFAAEASYYVGELEYREQRFAEAAKAYHDAMQKGGKTDLGEKAAHKLGWAYYRQGEYDNARKTFDYQRSQFPQSQLVGDAEFMMAESYFKLGKYAEALAAYQQVKNPAGKDFAVLALLHAGQAAAQLKEWDRSLQLLQRGAKEFPQSDYLPEILYEEGWAKQQQGKLDEATALYESVTAKTDAEIAARARFMIGEICFEKKDHAGAVKHFFKTAFGYGYPRWQAAAHFEAGRCFEVLNKTDQARKSYQEVVDKHPQSEQAEPARKRLAAIGS
ncbi:MAG TPA: tetratricopeptide repeat protein [Pirellulales bacterium]|jgi:TolA-binding protein